ncbi:phosphoribosylamine--glycine ligase [bacterium]|nr:phosphoribosylamine--glycine ligase [bacterium]
MHVLVIGGGGREHAVVAKLAASRHKLRLSCAPGNAGIAQVCPTVPISAGDIPAILDWTTEHGVDFVVVTPEDPLALGLVDRLAERGVPAFGPSAAATRIESSKAFAKEIMRRKGVPTARYGIFTDFPAARDYVMETCGPSGIVVKASGLALGKGALVCDHADEAVRALEELMLEKKFGAAGETVVIEERLAGEEASVFALSDGERFITLPPGQDHKRLLDGDAGPNTGGMGAYCPAPVVDARLMARIEREILAPTLAGLAEVGCPFKGVLYCGLMVCDGDPYVIEFNARFGDPETQAILPLLESDLFDLMYACHAGGVDRVETRWRSGACTCVVLASGGYPGGYEKGKVIMGLNEDFGPDVYVFHAGTRVEEGKVVTAGGRVLGVSAWGADLAESARRAYAAADRINFEGRHLRRDIAWRGLARLEAKR